MITEEKRHIVLTAIKVASKKWKTAFNSGDAEGCAAQYEADAVTPCVRIVVASNI